MAAILVLFAVFVLCQGVIAQAPAARDVVVLNTGALLVGELLHDSDRYVQIRLPDSTVIGLERSRIVSVRHGTGTQPPGADDLEVAPPREQWFVLHDADGIAVGTLQATKITTPDGRVRLGEEWSFAGDAETTEITVLEVVTADLQPLSSFYHERVRRSDGVVLHERLIDARVRDGVLAVDARIDTDRQRVEYPWNSGATFPLSVLEQLRHDEGDAVRSCTVWDPARAALVRRTFVAQRENTVWDGEPRYVRELSWRDSDGEGREWVDTRDACLRREVNGPALIAVPCSASRAGGIVFDHEPRFPPSRVWAPDGDFGLWLPAPSWQIDENAPEGSVGICCEAYGASARLLAFDQIDPDLALASAADAVQRWVALTRPSARLRSRDGARIRGVDAVVLHLEDEHIQPGAVTLLREAVYVFQVRDRVLALWLEAPSRSWDAAERDFERLLQQVELRPVRPPQGVAGPILVDGRTH